jgi:hypothetical protein
VTLGDDVLAFFVRDGGGEEARPGGSVAGAEGAAAAARTPKARLPRPPRSPKMMGS